MEHTEQEQAFVLDAASDGDYIDIRIVARLDAERRCGKDRRKEPRAEERRAGGAK